MRQIHGENLFHLNWLYGVFERVWIPMAVNKNANQPVEKSDLINIAILLSISLGIGVYLIATTVLISQDGTLHIELAQILSSGQVDSIKGQPLGYSFLVCVAHKLFGFFGNSCSVYGWIYSAQTVTLLCRLLTLIALYFTGKLLLGRKESFWAILILIMLPYPARFGSDVLKDWPHLLFLSIGFLFLLLGANRRKLYAFGVAGAAAGLGHMIRAECTQIIIYGVLWLTANFFWKKRIISRPQTLAAFALLLIGFTIPSVPYWMTGGPAFPPQIKELFNSSGNACPNEEECLSVRFESSDKQTAAISIGDAAKGFAMLGKKVSENLSVFFVPALFLGMYHHLRRQVRYREDFLILAFTLFNITIMVLLYCIRGYISKRHCMPLVALTIFYVPSGLQIIGNWLAGRFFKVKSDNNSSLEKQRLCFLVLVVTGLCICLPKLLRPMRMEKQGYRDAAKWLKDNTTQGDIAAVPDKRISFYAERNGLEYEDANIPAEVVCVVKNVRNEEEKLNFEKLFPGRAMQEELWFWTDTRKKKEKLVIYRIMRPKASAPAIGFGPPQSAQIRVGLLAFPQKHKRNRPCQDV